MNSEKIYDTSRAPNNFLHHITAGVGGKSDSCRYCLSVAVSFLNASLYSLSKASVDRKSSTNTFMGHRSKVISISVQ